MAGLRIASIRRRRFSWVVRASHGRVISESFRFFWPSKFMSEIPKLSVVMPAYNEIATIEEIIARVQAIAIDKEIIVVDDGSSDGTREYLTRLRSRVESGESSGGSGRLTKIDNLRIFLQEKNCGKGAALRRGFHEARGEVVVIQDADLELDPQEYPKLIKPIDQGVADVVYGSRFLGRSRQGQPFAYYLANKILTVTSNILTGLRLTDVWTGYKMFRREVLQKIHLRENRFGFEPEVTAKIAKCGCRVSEVAVSYTCRPREEGKKIGWKDSVRGMWCTIRYSLLPDRAQETSGAAVGVCSTDN
jgi:glycosyltransferase involved in cell wall biosynthesis